jgi:hypothetical protein
VQLSVSFSLDVELTQPLELDLVHHQLVQSDVLARILQLSSHLRRVIIVNK